MLTGLQLLALLLPLQRACARCAVRAQPARRACARVRASSVRLGACAWPSRAGQGRGHGQVPRGRHDVLECIGRVDAAGAARAPRRLAATSSRCRATSAAHRRGPRTTMGAVVLSLLALGPAQRSPAYPDERLRRRVLFLLVSTRRPERPGSCGLPARDDAVDGIGVGQLHERIGRERLPARPEPTVGFTHVRHRLVRPAVLPERYTGAACSADPGPCSSGAWRVALCSPL
jgi:hypothetical protein